MRDTVVAESFVVDDVKNAPDVENENGFELIVNGDVVDTITTDDDNEVYDMLRSFGKVEQFKPGDIIIIQSFKVVKRVMLK